MVKEYYLVSIIFLLLFVNSNFAYAQETEDTGKKLKEILQKLENYSGLAQWLVVIILASSAGLILKQIKTQNTVSRGQNFLELIKMINDTEHIQGLNLIFEEYEKNPDIFKKSDSELPEHIKNAVLRVKNNYHSIGLILHVKMVGQVEFLKLHSRESRYAWDILKINHEKTNESRNKNEKNPDEYHRGFRILGLTSSFWLRLTFWERVWVMDGYLGVSPGTMYYNIRMSITENLEKISKRVNKESSKNFIKKITVKSKHIPNQLKVKLLKKEK